MPIRDKAASFWFDLQEGQIRDLFNFKALRLRGVKRLAPEVGKVKLCRKRLVASQWAFSHAVRNVNPPREVTTATQHTSRTQTLRSEPNSGRFVFTVARRTQSSPGFSATSLC